MASSPGLVNGGEKSNSVVLGGIHSYSSKVTVVLGAQWGDEGKGKVVDMLATEVDIVTRCQVKLIISYHVITIRRAAFIEKTQNKINFQQQNT